MGETLYFRDNFFSAGTTEIFNKDEVKVGELDLKSAFSASVDVLNLDRKIIISGKFPLFSNKWLVTNALEEEVGILKQNFTFLSKKYQYTTDSRGVYSIESEAFSYQYEIFGEQSNLVAKFEKVSGFFSSPAYRLENLSKEVSSEEWVAVVMGINAIQKRRRNASNASV